jgi:ribosomal protein S18 acetylase RimI-like enzyme
LEEVQCVDELWEEYLTRGSDSSGYYFLVEKDEDRVVGYVCYGPRSLTSGTFDLYWIAVDPNIRRGGIGRRLLDACEQAIRNLGGRLIVLETSGLPNYEPTRKFYLATGYTLEATLKDFYHEGDDLIIFTKHL